MRESDTPWRCFCCGVAISYTEDPPVLEGVSLTEDTELQVCRLCWRSMRAAEQIETIRRWRMDKTYGKLANVIMAGLEHIAGDEDRPFPWLGRGAN